MSATDVKQSKTKNRSMAQDLELPLFSTDPGVLSENICRLYAGQKCGHDPYEGLETEAALEQHTMHSTFGEVTPVSLVTIFDKTHLNLGGTEFFCDLGMGNGKVAMQAFLSFPNLKKVVGVELVSARYENGVAALKRLQKLLPKSTLTERKQPPAVILTTGDKRTLEFRKDNLLNATDCLDAGVVFCEVVVPNTAGEALSNFLSRFKKGTNLLSYEHLSMIYGERTNHYLHFNVGEAFDTSWGEYDFYFGTKTS